MVQHSISWADLHELAAKHHRYPVADALHHRLWGLVATTPGARQCRRNSSLAPVATITSCSGVKNNNNRAGHVCPYFA